MNDEPDESDRELARLTRLLQDLDGRTDVQLREMLAAMLTGRMHRTGRTLEELFQRLAQPLLGLGWQLDYGRGRISCSQGYVPLHELKRHAEDLLQRPRRPGVQLGVRIEGCFIPLDDLCHAIAALDPDWCGAE
jgi:hypothetical protein